MRRCRAASNQMIERRLAQPPRRDVDDPGKGQVILGVGHQVEVRQDVLDFLPLIKRDAAHDLVGDLGGAKGLLDGTRQSGHPAEDRDVAEPEFALPDQAVDLARDPLGLIGLAGVDGQLDRCAPRVLGHERFGLAVAVEPDQVIGDAQDVLRAAVVPLELDDPATGVIVLELEDIRQVGPSPAVDRLVGVARDAKVGMIDREGSDDGVLSKVRVLVLIDEDVPVAAVEACPDVGVVLEDRHDVDEQVVEIDGRRGPQLLLVGSEHPRVQQILLVSCSGPEHLGADQVVLGPADGRLDAFGGDAHPVADKLIHDVLDGAEAVGLVVDREPGIDPHQLGVNAQQPGAKAVERPHPDPGIRAPGPRSAGASRRPPCS